MKLSNLLRDTGVTVPRTIAGVDAVSLEDDSRKVSRGTLFVAVRGFKTDGHLFIDDALGRGACAVLAERPSGEDPRILVNPSGCNREMLAELSARFYGYPWKELTTVAVTGTNGKTSTVRMLRFILEGQGISTGIMGTTGHIAAGGELPASMTTPGALEVSSMMRRMVEGGDRCCVMEVSSHALALGRVEMVGFDLALFTNISQDHLDFHEDMEDYLRSKMHLLDLLNTGGRAVVGTYAEGFPKIEGALTFGEGAADTYRVAGISTSLADVSFSLHFPGGTADVMVPVPGRFNVFNAAGAIAAAAELGIDPVRAARSLAGFAGVPGRFQPVDLGQDFLVAVDYAHTPDALRRVLEQAAELTSGKVIVVFGAGGDRDRAKRPLMGSIAGRLADVLIVTSDNPRTEEPGSIISQIVEGIEPSSGISLEVEPDRRKAIRSAIMSASPGDVVLIAGKGHEDYQEIDGERFHFDDREEASKVLKELPR